MLVEFHFGLLPPFTTFNVEACCSLFSSTLLGANNTREAGLVRFLAHRLSSLKFRCTSHLNSTYAHRCNPRSATLPHELFVEHLSGNPISPDRRISNPLFCCPDMVVTSFQCAVREETQFLITVGGSLSKGGIANNGHVASGSSDNQSCADGLTSATDSGGTTYANR